MAKSDKKTTSIGQEQTRVNEQFSSLTAEMDAKRKEKDEQSKRDRAALTGTLETMAGPTGGLDQTVVGNIRGLYGGKSVGMDGGSSGGGGGGGSDSGGGGGGGGTPAAAPVDPYAQPKSIFEEFGKTGGVEMDKMRAQITELENMAKTGAIDPAQKDSINATIQKLKDFQFDPAARAQIQTQVDRLTEMGQTGGYDPARLAQINSDIDSLRQWSQTGGIDPARLAQLRGTQDFMMGGGISADDLSRWRGTGFDEFAKTGGWSDADRADFRDRATSGIPAMYQSNMQEAARRANIQGGGGGGFLAAAGQQGRQQAQEMATARRDAEIDLGGQVRAGRQFGITGLANTEKDIQSQYGLNRGAGMQAGNQLELGVGQNRITGLSNVAERQAALEKDISSNRITATELSGRLNKDTQDSINDAFIRSQSGAGTLETNLADAIGKNRVAAQAAAATAEGKAQQLRQEGQLAGAQGLMQVAAQKAAEAARAAAAGAAARANDQANERWWANFQSGNEQWIGAHQQQGQQYATEQQRLMLGMDETLARDKFGVDTASQWADANKGLLQTAAMDKGTDWSKYAALGIGGAQAYNDYRDKGTSAADLSGGNPRGSFGNYGAGDIGGAYNPGYGNPPGGMGDNPYIGVPNEPGGGGGNWGFNNPGYGTPPSFDW